MAEIIIVPRSSDMWKTAVELFGADILDNIEVIHEDTKVYGENVKANGRKIYIDVGSEMKITFKNGKQIVFSTSEWSSLSPDWSIENDSDTEK